MTPNGGISPSASNVEQDRIMEPIAVIGMAARLPEDEVSGGDFWEMIKQGHTAASEIPKDRINMDAFYHPNADRSDTTNVRSGHFLKGNIAAFDAPFFTIKPTEAESMDPQQRMLLETSFHALENAGISMESSAGSQTGVYFAASTRDYEVLMYRDPELTPKYMGTGIGTSLLANRVSWFFDFLGPSITLDTACSGSLTAVHLACQSLRNRECSMALTGGGSLILAPEVSMSQLSTLGFLSPDGRSYSFDSRANGYAKGEGLGMVVLKRYDDAIRDRDTIRAIIRATSINQDGHTPGITRPSKKAQTDNILQAYRAAGLNLDHTTYFEAHGTGTAAGDPFEAEAIHAAFKRKPGNPLYIGSLKANIGHLEAGAGIAAIIKCVLVLEAGTIPPNTNFEHHNPEIPIEQWNLKFLKDAIPFSNARVRRISANSFGYGGTNAHAILDGIHHSPDRSTYAKQPMSTGPPTNARNDVGNGHYANCINGNDSINMMDYITEYENSSIANEPRWILPFSAADENGIERLANAYNDHFKKALGDNHHVLRQEEKEYLTNLTYTLCSRRSQLPWKAFAVVQSCKDLMFDFASLLSKARRSSYAPSISYVFTGQGAQWYAMAQGLSVFPVFLESLQKSQHYLIDEGCDWTIEDEFNRSENKSRVDEPRLSQTLCTILQMALVDLLTSWRFKPSAVTGHSSGEIAAAYCAGALSHASAIKIAYYRGLAASSLLTKSERQGAMIAVGLSMEDATLYIEEAMLASSSQLSVGCVNAPQNITITGDRQGIDLLQKMFDSRQIFAKKLKVPIAYHSYHMEEVASEYHHHIQQCLSQAQSTDLSIQPVMFSSVTGGRISPKELGNPEYWVKNLTNRVKFSDSVSLMAGFLLQQQRKSDATSGKDVILEIGPHSALQRPVKDTINAVAGNKDIEYDSLLSNTMDSRLALASAVGRLWCRGCLIDLALVNHPSEHLSAVHTLTNLPAYPFNHSQSYWVESRLSKNFKFREYPRHELLGVREVDWNPLQPKWRNVIRVAEHPWIHDHKFSDTRLYPATATIVMAIEAARQFAGLESGLSDYELSDLTFPNGFVLPPEATTVETQLHFYPHNINGTSKPHRHDFTVFALSKDIWTEICTGTIEIKSQDSNLHYIEDSGSQPQDDGKLQHGVSGGWERINSSQFYDSLATCGYDFGPAFQNLGNIRFTEDGEAAANVLLDGWTGKVESNPDIAPHVIHPTTLDAFFQSSVAAHSQGGRLNIPVLVPTQLKSLYISGELLNRKPEQAVNLLTRTTFRGFREADFSIRAISANHRIQFQAKGFRQTALNDQRTVVETQLRRSCYRVDWKADLDMLSREDITDIYEEAIDGRPRLADDSVLTEELVALYFMHQALIDNSRTMGTKAASHLNKYMLWMQHRCDPEKLCSLRQSHPDFDMLFGNDENRDNFLSDFAQQSIEGRLIVKVGRLLAQIMCGEVDALELLFGEEKILNDYYVSPSFMSNFTGLISYIDLAAHKNPVMNILEVGAGTGSLTGRVLESLLRYSERSDGSKDGPRMQHYTFSDISTGFFEEAKQKFKDFSSHLTFAVFDLEKDPLSQGYQMAQYDMVIASLVLHATTNVSKTLGNIRKVLKPGGKLILFEPCAPEAARVAFVFGLLPGWWLSEEKEREWSPLLKPANWHEKLLQNGFSGIDVHLPDHKAPTKHTFSGMITTAIEAASSGVGNKPPMTVIAAETLYQQEVAERIREALSLEGGARILSQDQFLASNMLDVHYISLLELGSSFFEQIDEDRWSAFKSLVTSTASILWVTQADSTSNKIAELGMVTGLGRAIRSENMDSQFIQLALEPSGSGYHVVEQVLKIHRTLLNAPPEMLAEHEFQEKSGRLCIGRLAEAGPLNQDLHQDMNVLKAVPTPFGIDPERRLELAIETPGLLNTLQFRDDRLHDKPLGPTDVEIEVKASGVNFKDILIALGRLAADHLGFDCAGFVSRAGPETGYCPGDRVCACTITGGYKNFVRTDASAVITVPERLSLNLAAGIPIVFNTVYYSLVTVANLQQGESVLIHSGAGGIGQAAIQLAQRLGARIFTTVGSDQKRATIMKLYNIPSDHIFSSRNMDFVTKILSITDTGVDVVLNSLGGRGRTGTWSSCLAPLGRFVDLGKPEVDSQRKGLPMAPFANNVSFHSVSLDVVMHTAKPLMRRITSAVSDLLNDIPPITTPEPLHVYPVSRIEEAFRFMQTGQNDGKIVVEMLRSDIVPVLPSTKPRYYFKDDATYVIAGGLGGLGRSIVQWMVGRNARHFLLLSRSGTDNNAAARDLIAAMKARGISILAPRCDITDEDAVKRILEECKQTMPPIKGCIQASMVLKVLNLPLKKTPQNEAFSDQKYQDGLLNRTSASDLHTVLRPKTTGTLNLHKHLPSPLTFFVLLSSIASMTGSRGQANYATANAFQDAFASSIASPHSPCVSLNLGAILSVGFAAEHNLAPALRKDGFEGIGKAEFLALMDRVCDPECPEARDPATAHIVSGLAGAETLPPAHFRNVYWTSKPMFRPLLQVNALTYSHHAAANDRASAQEEEYGVRLAGAKSSDDARGVVLAALVDRLARLLAIPEHDVDIRKPLPAFGIDSLVALELRQWIKRDFRAEMSIFDVVQASSVVELAEMVMQKTELWVETGKVEER